MRLKGLIENLNADNRILYGHGRCVREEVRLPALIRNVLCGFADANDGLPYDFVCEIDDDAEGCVILSDEALVRRLLENLIGNSVRHNPGGCTVKVGLSRIRRPLRSRWLLSISDDGCGTAPEVITVLNSGTESAEVRDHGLGLRVVSHIVRKYRWKIRYSSVPGKGFTAGIELHLQNGIKTGLLQF